MRDALMVRADSKHRLFVLTRERAEQHTVIVLAIVFWIVRCLATKLHEHWCVFEAVAFVKIFPGPLQSTQQIVILGGQGEITNAVQHF